MNQLDLNEPQRSAIVFLKERGRISNPEYQKVANAIKKTATRDLKDLVNKGVLDQRGTRGPGVHYVLATNRDKMKVRSLAVRPMRRKWASCSTAGNLNFNSELLELDRELGDYVIVHELLHFSVHNHGKLWKSLMRAHLGDYERVEAKLKGAQMKAIDPSLTKKTKRHLTSRAVR